jgi:prophage regulatory protein
LAPHAGVQIRFGRPRPAFISLGPSETQEPKIDIRSPKIPALSWEKVKRELRVFAMADILIRSREVQARTGLPKSSLHNKVKAGAFPAPVKLGPRAVAWRESDVDAWIESRLPGEVGGQEATHS